MIARQDKERLIGGVSIGGVLGFPERKEKKRKRRKTKKSRR